jgi:integrase/recombinase XerD
MPSLHTRQKHLVNNRPVWRYRRIKEGRGKQTGDLSGPFYARKTISGKMTWKKLYAETFKEARSEAEQIEAALDAQAKGLTVAEAEALSNAQRIPIRTAVDKYLEQKSGKAKKTQMQYRLTLNEFIASVADRARFLDEITDDVLRLYKKYMTAQGYAGKTIDTRLNIIFFMLKKNGIKARIPRDEMPIVERLCAVLFTKEFLNKLFAAMDEEQTLLYKFFLGTGCRDREVAFAEWSDIDLANYTYHVRAKPDAGFTLKSHESRSVVMPNSLVKLLENANRKVGCRWVFSNRSGGPENHALRKLKVIALRAGLNCGQCRTTIDVGRYDRKTMEVSCKTHPVCEQIYLHRLRKTCATRWHNNGVPIDTIREFLGHKSLATTQLYLGVASRSKKLQSQIDMAAAGD